MGIDRQVWVAWGRKVELDKATLDKVKNDDLQMPNGITLLEWGGLSYGSPGGYVIALRETVTLIDPKENCNLIKELPDDRTWNRVHGVGRLMEAQDKLKPTSLEHDVAAVSVGEHHYECTLTRDEVT